VWRQKWFALPAIAIAVAAAVFVYLEGPRSYDSTQSFALANPKVPTEKEIDADPSLLQLNSDNPYLRSSDPNLVANVVITRLNSQETAKRLEDAGLSTDYTVNSGALGGGLVVSISAAGETPEEAVEAVEQLGELLTTYLHEVQTVNGADERFLFTAIMVSAPSEPTEQLSSRLRTVVVVAIAGLALVFGAISLGTWISNVRAKRAMRKARARNEADDTEEARNEPARRGPRARYRPLDATVIVQSEARRR
jgi:capsular polysaccharide biosynthesis protein